MNNTWQLCPKCNGEGTVTNFFGSAINTSATCSVCNGRKIISCLTGLPPNHYSTLPSVSEVESIKQA